MRTTTRTSKRPTPSTRRRRPLAAVALVALVAAGCGAEAEVVAAGEGPGGSVPGTSVGGTTTLPAEAPADAPIALVETDGGLAGVPVGWSTPRWVAEGAAAAPDGSAVFRVDVGAAGPRLVRLDPRSGTPTGWFALERADQHVAAVEPGGHKVVLVADAGDSTDVSVAGTNTAGGPSADAALPVLEQAHRFEGELDPEAISADGQWVFAARIYGDRYHVHVLSLPDGQQWPTLGPDKGAEPEDMYGNVVQAVASPDGSSLATLYRDPVKPEHTAFIHLLDLRNGTTVCIDLHEPFGTAGPGTDALAWRDNGTIVAGHTPSDGSPATAAIFRPDSLWSEPAAPHHHATVRPDVEPPTVPEAIATTPGFRRFVALAA